MQKIRTIRTIAALKKALRQARDKGKIIGLVPTMGALHEGHLSLIRRSVRQTDFTVVSIFINPTQFAPNEDLSSYPRSLNRDIRLAADAGAHLAFVPAGEVMYPEGFRTEVAVKELSATLCGASRPTHFAGVTTVVAKLFNMVQPDRAYFGRKDAQQAFVIKRMVRDLDMSVRIVVCPTVRESDGLAMSSRNAYLSASQRAQAPVLHRALLGARAEIRSGQRNCAKLKTLVRRTINSANEARIDYVEIVDVCKLQSVRELKEKCLLAVAVFFGSTRLIDNEIVNVYPKGRTSHAVANA